MCAEVQMEQFFERLQFLGGFEPPLALGEKGDDFLVEPHSQHPRRISNGDREIRYILRNDGSCADNCAVSNVYPPQYHRSVSYPNVMPYPRFSSHGVSFETSIKQILIERQRNVLG